MFLADVECANAACCPGDALLSLDNRSNIDVEGNQHTLFRHEDHRQCDAISGRNASGIAIHNLNIDDDASALPCTPGDQLCAPSIVFSNGSNIDLRNVRIYNARGFAISVSGVDGFSFSQSAIVNAGVIGLYVGASSTGIASNHIKIIDSVFTGARTNAICLDGVKGGRTSDNEIAGNVVVQNHRYGLYLDVNNRPYNGGQIYLPNLVQATVSNNVVGLGFCANCNNAMVWGFELGPKAVSSVTFSSNVFFDSYGMAFFRNTGLKLDASDVIEKTIVYDSTGLSLGGLNNDLGTTSLSKNDVLGSYSPGKSRNPTFAIYRMRYRGHHVETAFDSGLDGGVIEAVFALSAIPRIAAPLYPILGCTTSEDQNGDRGTEFASTSNNCEGQRIRRVLGYSYEDTYPGAMPFYRCRSAEDRFLSWDAKCEGHTVEGRIGYALPTAFFHSKASAR
jgi:hypothetical protein